MGDTPIPPPRALLSVWSRGKSLPLPKGSSKPGCSIPGQEGAPGAPGAPAQVGDTSTEEHRSCGTTVGAATPGCPPPSTLLSPIRVRGCQQGSGVF